MWDNWLEDLYAPIVQCSKCHKKLKMKGDYIPKVCYCSNCGQEITVSFGEDYRFPNTKYDENGDVILPYKKEELKEKDSE